MNQYSFSILSIIFAFCNALPIVDVTLEEQGGFFEGDLNLTPTQFRDVFINKNAGLLSSNSRWRRDNNGIVNVPYTITQGAPYTQAHQNIIRSAMNEIERNTCVRFVPRTSQQDYVRIFSGSGCWSNVGRIGGVQEISLAHQGSSTCLTNGIVLHELIHSLGFYHMQSSPNRDDFIRINYENIKDGMEPFFSKHSSRLIGMFSTSYDIDSVMHYSRSSFSKNGRDTITTLNPSHQNRIGQRRGMSQGDITRIRTMYNCR